MKKLEKKFSKRGFKYSEVKREGDTALYKLTRNDIHHYEIFEVMKHKECTIKGNLIPAREATPSDEQWGTSGFSTPNKDKAFRIFTKIQNNILQRQQNTK